MQAITTKYLGPTNFRGGRIKAQAWAGSITVSWDHALDTDGNHDAAALALVRKLGWDKADRIHMRLDPVLYRGGLPNNQGNVYVFPSEYDRVEIVPAEGRVAK